MTYKYHFTSTLNDLLDAEEADATRTAGRRSLRWVVAGIGAGGVFSAIHQLSTSHVGWYSIAGLVVGSYIVYSSVLVTYVRRRRIRRDNPPSVDIALRFGEGGVQVELVGYGTYERKWTELVKFADAAKGVLLYFDDGTVNWLPNRIFRDKAEKRALLGLLRSSQDQQDDSTADDPE